MIINSRPSAVDIDEAQKMAVLERLQYAFNVAEKEFQVHSLLDAAGIVDSIFLDN